MTGTNLTERLDALLNAEREALMVGDFERISSLLEQKEALVDELRSTGTTAEALTPLRTRLRRNQELFDQALAGIRNVAARLGDLNRVRKSVETYDSKGKKQMISGTATRTLERRA